MFAALLLAARRIWELEPGSLTSRTSALGMELAGRRIAVIGLGRIGAKVAQIAMGLGMEVCSPSERKIVGVTRTDQGSALSSSTFITLHVPKSAGIVLGENEIRLLKDNAIIVNSSGHEIVDLLALRAYLRENPLATYINLAMPEASYFAALGGLNNAILYPLFSNRTEEARTRQRSFVVENLQPELDGLTVEARVI